jgi:hypothetical protein
MNQKIPQDQDGFHVLAEVFTLPEDSVNLDPQRKRSLTICNLFVNHQISISDVARVLDEDRRNVVRVLLKQGIIGDRRVRQTRPADGMEHRKTVFSSKAASRTP